MTRAVFVDRDGTLIVEKPYLHRIDDVEVIPRCGKALARLRKRGFLLVMVTNQSGVGRGYFTLDDVQRVHRHLLAALQNYGAALDGIYICPHHPDDNCECRKPRPKLVKDAAEKFGIDLAKSYIIGDQEVDIQLGRNTGCAPVLVRTGYGPRTIAEGKVCPDHIADALSEAVDWILRREDSTER